MNGLNSSYTLSCVGNLAIHSLLSGEQPFVSHISSSFRDISCRPIYPHVCIRHLLSSYLSSHVYIERSPVVFILTCLHRDTSCCIYPQMSALRHLCMPTVNNAIVGIPCPLFPSFLNSYAPLRISYRHNMCPSYDSFLYRIIIRRLFLFVLLYFPERVVCYFLNQSCCHSSIASHPKCSH